MFKRREKRSFARSMKEYFWPTMGWRRYGRLLWLRLKRISVRSPSHCVATGLSLGWFVSFNPMIGTHTVWILSLSWLLRANIFATFVGSLVGNIWTFPLFLWMSYQMGDAVMTLLSMPPDFSFLKSLGVFEDAGDKFFVMLLGWPFMGAIAFVLAYIPNYYLVRMLKKAYHDKIEKKKA